MSRKTFVYTQGGQPLSEPYEVSDDWQQPDKGPSRVSECEVYDGLRQHDGTVTDTKKKLREWQRRTGMEHVSEQQQEATRVRAAREVERREGSKQAAVEAFRKLYATGGRRK